MVTKVSTFANNTNYSEWNGLSTDPKPLKGIGNGSRFFELDTQWIYKFDEENKVWRPWAKSTGGGGDVPYATDSEVTEALDALFDGHK